MIRKSRNGFTLIELLVVIAIIAILAAILFPVFAKAREKARQAACLSNVKQMAMGIMMYKDDYDQTFPPEYNYQATPFSGGDSGIGSGTGDNPYAWPWQQLIYPYTKNYNISYCPSSPSPYAGSWCAYYQYGASDQILGYVPGTYCQGYIAPFNAGVKTDADVQSAADKYMIMDWGVHQVNWYYGVIQPFGSHYLPGGGVVDACKQAADGWGGVDFPSDFENGRHNGGINVGFADGHAKFQQSKQIYSQTRDNTLYNYVHKNDAGFQAKTPDPWTSNI